MSLLESLKRGWWSGWAEFPELVAGGAGLLESIIPGDRPDDPLERLKDWGNEAAQGLRLEGGEGTSEGLLEKITEGLGAAPGTLASMAPFMYGGGIAAGARVGAAGAGILGPALGFGAHGLIRHGDEGLPTAIGHGLRGAAEGAVFGGIGGWAGKKYVPTAAEELLAKRRYLKTVPGEASERLSARFGRQLEETGINSLRRQIGRKAWHGAGTGAFVGGMTALHGGDVEESVSAGATMGLLGLLAGGKYHEPAMTKEIAVGEVAKDINEYVKNKPFEELKLPSAKEFEPAEAKPFEPQSYADVAREAAPYDSPLRTLPDRATFDALEPGAKKALIDRQFEHQPHNAEYMREAIQRREPQTKVSDYDILTLGAETNELLRLKANIAQRKHQAIMNNDGVAIEEANVLAKNLGLAEVAPFEQISGATTTAGRALRAVRTYRAGSPEWFQAIERFDKSIGKDLAERVKTLAVLSDGSPELLSRLAKAINTPSAWDYFQEYWINGLLSGIPTQAVNISSNALIGGADLVEKSAGMVAAVKSGKIDKTAAIGEMKADVHAMMSAIKIVPRIFTRLLNEDYMGEFIKQKPRYEPLTERSKLDHPSAAIPGMLGKAVRLPGTALQAMDIAFKIVAGERYAAAKAYEMAYKDFKDGKITESEIRTQADTYNGVGAEPHRDVLKAMKEAGQRLTYTEKLGPGLTRVNSVLDMETWVPFFGKGKPGKLVVPFLSTPWNVIRQAVMRSPLGIHRMNSLKSKYEAGKITPQEFYREGASTAIGTALWASMIGMAQAGFITGGGPANQQDRQNLLATGWRPYSLKIGDTYWQLQRLEPLGTILGMAADVSEFGDAEDKTGKAIATIKDNLTDKSFLYGLESFAKAFANPEQFGATYYKQMTGSLVPTFFSKLSQAVDPYQRHQEAFGADTGVPDSVAYRIPFLSGALPSRSTALGESAERWGTFSTDGPLQRATSAFQSIVAPTPTSRVRENTEVEQEFDRLRNYPKMPPSMPKRSKTMTLQGVGGQKVKLTNDEYAIYDKYHQRAKQHLSTMISSARWSSIPDPLKAQMMRKVYDKYRYAANREINMSIRRRTTVGG